MLRNIIKDLIKIKNHLASIIISFLIIKSLSIFFIEILITFKTANIYLTFKEILKRR